MKTNLNQNTHLNRFVWHEEMLFFKIRWKQHRSNLITRRPSPTTRPDPQGTLVTQNTTSMTIALLSIITNLTWVLSHSLPTTSADCSTKGNRQTKGNPQGATKGKVPQKAQRVWCSPELLIPIKKAHSELRLGQSRLPDGLQFIPNET